MRKLLSLILIYSLNAYAVPPVSVDSEQSAVGNYVQNTKLPNEQATQLTTRNTRIETGNTNLLKNPSFEHLTLGFGWTITNATYALNTTNQVEGKKAITLTPSAAMTFGQDSSINAANINGLQGVASVKIKATGTTGLKVCPRNAGAAVTSLCVNVTADNTWKHVSIPFILGATSNGIGIATTATGGTVIVDDAFVGTSAPFQDVSGARLMGSIVISGCAAGWTTTSTSFVDFSATTGCTYSLTGGASSPATMIPAIKFASLPAGDYRIEYEGLFGSAGSSNSAAFQFWDGVNTVRETSWSNGASNGTTMSPGISQSITYSTAQSNITFSLRAKVGGASTTAYTYGQTTFPSTIKVWYFPPASKIYSQASQDYDWTAYTPTFTSLNTPTSVECFHKRKGSDLFLRCKYVGNGGAASEARISLPNSLVVDPNKTPSIHYAANLISSYSTTFDSAYYVLSEPSVSYLTFGIYSTGSSAFSKVNGSTGIGTNGRIFSFETGPIPISGWQDYGVIVGSFAGLEKCANDYECTDTFSARIAPTTCAVTNQNLPWIASTSLTGSAQCNIVYQTYLKDGTNPLSSVMNCVATSFQSGSSKVVDVVSDSSTGLSLVVMNSTTGASSADTIMLKCQKGSQDYKAKTAKVASSIGVPTVPGIVTTGTGNSIDTFSFSYGTGAYNVACSASPCSYLDQIGTVVLSVTRSSSGNYTANLGKTYSKLKCMIAAAAGSSFGSGVINPVASNVSSFSWITRNLSNVDQDTASTLTCQGTY